MFTHGWALSLHMCNFGQARRLARDYERDRVLRIASFLALGSAWVIYFWDQPPSTPSKIMVTLRLGSPMI